MPALSLASGGAGGGNGSEHLTRSRRAAHPSRVRTTSGNSLKCRYCRAEVTGSARYSGSKISSGGTGPSARVSAMGCSRLNQRMIGAPAMTGRIAVTRRG